MYLTHAFHKKAQKIPRNAIQTAEKLNTKKSAISHIENHAKDIKLSTLENFVRALGKKLRLEVA